MLYNGDNNGSLYLSVRDAAHRIGVADLSAASRAFDALVELGFIEVVQGSRFVPVSETSRARSWRLTWLAGPFRRAPSWQFLSREPEPKSLARKRMERGQRVLKAYRKARDGGKLPVLDSDTINPYLPDLSPRAVVDSNTLNGVNGGFQPFECVRDSATHIATTIGSVAPACPIGWWEGDWTPSISVGLRRPVNFLASSSWTTSNFASICRSAIRARTGWAYWSGRNAVLVQSWLAVANSRRDKS